MNIHIKSCLCCFIPWLMIRSRAWISMCMSLLILVRLWVNSCISSISWESFLKFFPRHRPSNLICSWLLDFWRSVLHTSRAWWSKGNCLVFVRHIDLGVWTARHTSSYFLQVIHWHTHSLSIWSKFSLFQFFPRASVPLTWSIVVSIAQHFTPKSRIPDYLIQWFYIISTCLVSSPNSIVSVVIVNLRWILVCLVNFLHLVFLKYGFCVVVPNHWVQLILRLRWICSLLYEIIDLSSLETWSEISASGIMIFRSNSSLIER